MRYPLWCVSGLLIAVLLGFLTGCGGGGGNAPASSTSTPLRLAIHWPQRSRDITTTASALSCRVQLFPSASDVSLSSPSYSWVIERNDAADAYTSTWVSPGRIRVQSWFLVLRFFAAHGAQGDVVAEASQAVLVDANGYGADAVTFAQRIVRVVIPAGQTVGVGQQQTLVCKAFDVNSTIVAISPGSVHWEVASGQEMLSFVLNKANGMSSGTAMVVATIDGISSNPTVVTVGSTPPGPTTKTNPVDGAEMVWVPAGSFLMGSPSGVGWGSERPQHTLTLGGYWIYKYEVTVGQYRAFCQATGHPFPTTTPAWGWQDDHPMVHVTWFDVTAYAAWANAALPTEAQWEKAARGTDGRIFPWGDDWDTTKFANITNSSGTHPVGSFPAGVSPYGAMDMAGNVWEWCADWYDAEYYAISPPVDPVGPVTGTYRILRGGSWHHNQDMSVRCAARNSNDPNGHWDGDGFRCVVNP